MVEQDLCDFAEMLCPLPVALQFTGHPQPSDGLRPSGHETTDRHVMRLRRDAAGRVRDGIHVVAVPHGVDGGLRQTHLRPERRDWLVGPGRIRDGEPDWCATPKGDALAYDLLGGGRLSADS